MDKFESLAHRAVVLQDGSTFSEMRNVELNGQIWQVEQVIPTFVMKQVRKATDTREPQWRYLLSRSPAITYHVTGLDVAFDPLSDIKIVLIRALAGRARPMDVATYLELIYKVTRLAEQAA